MKILFLYQVADYGIFGDSKIRSLLSAPVLRKYDMIPVSVGQLRPSERIPKIKKFIDRADFVTIGQGTYTFMRRWAREGGIYSFQQNKPMMSIDSGGINEGWSVESVAGPSPFFYLKWQKNGEKITVLNSSFIFDHFWHQHISVPISSVNYRLDGVEGVFDEFAPTFHWVDENGPKNFPHWVETALYLAGESI